MFDLRGQTALVTGASAGLGLVIAEALARQGADVIVNGRSKERAGKAADEIGGRPAVFDALKPSEAEAAVEAIDRDTPLSILVNNAGLRNRKGLEAYAEEEVTKMLAANAGAPFLLARKAGTRMAERGYGRIVNMTSVTGPLARAHDHPYGMAKSALEAATRSLAASFGPSGVTVNAVAPGFFRTQSNRELLADERLAAWGRERFALARFGEPEEIAGAAVFLASREASFITGQTIFVDGGMIGQY